MTGKTKRLDDAAATAYDACCAYLDAAEGADYAPVAEALYSFDAALGAARREHDAARPEGELAPGHPWRAGLYALNESIRVNDLLVQVVARRAHAKREGRLAEHDARREAEIVAQVRRFGGAPEEIGRREARTGRPLDPVTRAAIVDAHRGRR